MSLPSFEASQLIQRARDGSGSALGALLDSYRDSLLHVASHRLQWDIRPKLSPSDVVQGSMLVATQEFQQFRGDSEKEFRAWLLRIVATQIVDGLRRFVDTEKRRSDREVNRGDVAIQGIADDGETPSRLASLQEDAVQLLEAIESLPNSLRAVVQARYLQGMTFQQVAEFLDIPVTTCRRRWLDGIESIEQRMRGSV